MKSTRKQTGFDKPPSQPMNRLTALDKALRRVVDPRPLKPLEASLDTRRQSDATLRRPTRVEEHFVGNPKGELITGPNDISKDAILSATIASKLNLADLH